jgi:hypothetical protein
MFNICMMRQSIKTGKKKTNLLKTTISRKKLLHTKVMDKSMTLYNNQVTERNGKEGPRHMMKKCREGETGNGVFSKKAVAYKKMKDKNVWVKKCTATDCSTKQNRMAICQ